MPRILRVGLPDRYVTHGKPALLHEEVGFTGERIAERVRAAIGPRPGATHRRTRGRTWTGAIGALKRHWMAPRALTRCSPSAACSSRAAARRPR